ncbi:MAG: alpha/beta fold hydrolase [Promethearchaeota archaeon]
MTEFYIDVNDIKICYEIHGREDQYPILLVHGFGAKKEHWIAQISALSEKYKVIIFDNRDAGKTSRSNRPYTMETLADDIKCLMDKLNIDKTHIVGWSMGGAIVQNFVLKYPERVNKVILINTFLDLPADEGGIETLKKSRFDEIEMIKKDPDKAYWQSARIFFYREFRKEMQLNPNKKFYGVWSVENEIKETTINIPTHSEIENQINAIKTHKTIDRLSQIKNKTLLLAASHDKVCPKSNMVEMNKRIPNSILKIIEKAGHNSPKSRTPEVNKIILDFLK